jgi:DNA-binding CsgD family transcriptional regulator
VTDRTQAIEDRFWSKVKKTEGCWIWLGGTSKGYGRFALTRRKTVRAHRFSFEMANGLLAPGMCALHKCDNPGCVRPDHLFAGSDADNVADRDAKGRTAVGDRSGARTRPDARPRGSGHARARLTEAQVTLIKSRLREGATQRELAREFGVAEPTVSHIVAGRTWRQVA